MPASYSPRRRALAFLAGLLFAAFAALPLVAARADDTADSPLARLSAEERDNVRLKIPGVDALPREKQEQIARNVEWLRSLDPERRAKLLRRVNDAHAARVDGQKLDERVGAWHDLRARQPLALQQGLVIRGLGRVAWRDLPADLQGDPRVRALGERVLAVAFHRRFWSKAFRGLDAQAARTYEPPATVPPELRERVLKLRAQAVGDDKALGRLKEAVLQARAFEAVRTAAPATPGADAPRGEPPPERDGDARLLAVGERIRDLARPAYDETLAEIVAKWREKGADAWVAAVQEMAQPAAPPPEVRRKLEALQLVFTVEAWNGFLAQRPPLVGPADALLRAALVEELGMSSEEYARLPARGDGAAQEQRLEFLRQWIDQRSPLPREWIREAYRRRWNAAGGGDRPGGFPGRTRPAGERSGQQGPRRAPGAPAPGAPGPGSPGPGSPGELPPGDRPPVPPQPK